MWGQGEVIVDGRGEGVLQPGEIAPGCEPCYPERLRDLPEGWQKQGEYAQELMKKEVGYYNPAIWRECPDYYATVHELLADAIVETVEGDLLAELEPIVARIAAALPDSFSVERGRVVAFD